MCGIFGYIGFPQFDLCLTGLQMLLNRGYDAAGCATILDGKIVYKKYSSDQNCDAIDKLITAKEIFVKSTINILHCRWATHGSKNSINAHPQLDVKEQFAIVHNGIIDNYLEIKNKLTNYIFKS